MSAVQRDGEKAVETCKRKGSSAVKACVAKGQKLVDRVKSKWDAKVRAWKRFVHVDVVVIIVIWRLE